MCMCTYNITIYTRTRIHTFTHAHTSTHIHKNYTGGDK